MKTEKQVNHGTYVRKSSEAEDRQMLSIDSQIIEAKKMATQNNLKTDESYTLSESKSAKTPQDRPLFEELIENIENGKIQGIITWHPNRLSRNPIDAGRLVDLMDRGKLIQIVTQQQIFRNNPTDKFVFGLLCLQAKMENDNKSIDVKRGLRRKYEMGHPPSMAKIGYINDYGKKGGRKWLRDPERFGLVKQLWEQFLTGSYSIRKLLRYSDEVLGLKTVQRAKEGGKPMKLSALYRMLGDSFYAGFFFAKNENGEEIRYKVNESIPRIITEEQYWQAQKMLRRKGRPCLSKNKSNFAYVGRMKCGSCGGSVTAEHKYQLICPKCKKKFSYPNKAECPFCGIKIDDMDNPKYLHYIYYHCIKRKNPNCTERSIQEKDVDVHLATFFEQNLKISPSLRDWCLAHLDELASSDNQNRFEIRLNWEKEIDRKRKEYDELVEMRARKMIDDETFQRLETPKIEGIKIAEKALANSGGTSKDNSEGIKKVFDLAVGIAGIFKNGSPEERTEALSEVCSNLTLKDKKPIIQEKKEYSIIINGLLEAKVKNRAFEPAKIGSNELKTEAFASVIPTLLPR